MRDHVVVSAELAKLVAVCLEKYPEDRPSAKQVGEALDAMLEGVSTNATPVLESAVSSRRASALERGSPPRKRPPWVLMAMAAAGLGIGLWSWTQTGSRHERSSAPVDSVLPVSTTAVPVVRPMVSALPTVNTTSPSVMATASAAVTTGTAISPRPRAARAAPPKPVPTAAPTASSKGGLFKGRF